MKIGVIAPPWVAVPPPAYGGTETVLDILTRGLALAGHDVQLFATGDSTASVPTRFVVAHAPGVDLGGAALEYHHVVHAYQALADCHVIHDHTAIGPLLNEWLPDVAVVTTNHNPFADHFATLYRQVAKRVPIIAISHHHARSAGDIPIAAVIHHGLELDRFPDGDGRGGYALFLGRMSEGKGAHRAIRIARAAGIDIVLAGKMQSEAERLYYESEVEPLLDTHASYVGEVGVTDKLDLLAGATCLLNPIKWPEPFGMVMIEAMACGTPVLALAHGSVPEIVEDGVTGFVRDDEDQLVKALTEVGSIERSACRARIRTCFSAEVMVDKHVRLYESVVDARERAAGRT